MQTGRIFIVAAAVFGALAVALGAFGAHGLAAVLEANGRAETFDTAAHYHLIHAVALLVVGFLFGQAGMKHRLLRYAGWLLIAGILLFSGSLYMLAVFNIGFMGAVAPFGGAALVGGWLLVGAAAWRS